MQLVWRSLLSLPATSAAATQQARAQPLGGRSSSSNGRSSCSTGAEVRISAEVSDCRLENYGGPRLAAFADSTEVSLEVHGGDSPQAGSACGRQAGTWRHPAESLRPVAETPIASLANLAVVATSSGANVEAAHGNWSESALLQGQHASSADTALPALPGAVLPGRAATPSPQDLQQPLTTLACLENRGPDVVPQLGKLGGPLPLCVDGLVAGLSSVVDLPLTPRGDAFVDKASVQPADVAAPPCDTVAFTLAVRSGAALVTPSRAVAAQDRLDIVSACASVFPDVEVSVTSAALLLKWARWGRNSLRIRQEERLKAMQHVRYPRLPSAPRSRVSSPQPTPRSCDAESNRPTASPPLVERSVRGGRDVGKGGPSLLEELRQQQRDAMDEQGTRVKLIGVLGASQSVSGLSGYTPGFGMETPSLGASKSRASVGSSMASSGIASPVAGGQMSPWILEAEALLEAEPVSDDDPNGPGSSKGKTSHGWGIAPAVLGDIGLSAKALPMTPVSPAHGLPSVAEGSVLMEHTDMPIMDEDELDQVDFFVGSLMTESQQVVGLAGAASPAAVQLSSGPAQSPAESTNAAAGGLVPGERVMYFSKTRERWMDARVVEQKSTNVYIIDKQGKGCLAKVSASDLVTEAEMQRDPVLRAVSALDCYEDEDEDDCVAAASNAGGPNREPEGGSRTRAHEHVISQRRRPPQSLASPTAVATLADAPLPSSGCRLLGERSPQEPTPSRRVSPRSTSRGDKTATSPRKVAPDRGSGTPSTASTHSHSRGTSPRTVGKVIRDDFSSDSDNDSEHLAGKAGAKVSMRPLPSDPQSAGRGATRSLGAATGHPYTTPVCHHDHAAMPVALRPSARHAVGNRGRSPMPQKIKSCSMLAGRIVRHDLSSDESSEEAGRAPASLPRCQPQSVRPVRDDFSDDSDG